jgi:hypothetical protein
LQLFGKPIRPSRVRTSSGSNARPSCQPPHVICTTTSGRRVGVEICQWVHEYEMADSKLREKICQTILNAIGRPPMNRPKHFWLVVFHPKSKSQLSAGEHKAFRKAFFELIEYVDRAWPNLEHRGRFYRARDLTTFKPLGKYLEAVSFCPPDNALDSAVEGAIEVSGGNMEASQTEEERREALDWIVPVSHPRWIRTRHDAEQWEPDDHGRYVSVEGFLLKKLLDKAAGCSPHKLKTDCSEVYLLIAFHEAISNCSLIPFPMPEIARKAAERARTSSSWPFHRTFLLIADEDKPSVHRLL